jgi:RNA polymerase sigma-70 factor (ECF subfamily)
VSLRQTLVTRYDMLVRRLTRSLGSPDLASEAIHDAWLRLEKAPDPATVRDSYAYVLRAASNEAAEVRRREARRAAKLGLADTPADGGDGDPVALIPDDAPDPEQVAIVRAEWSALKAAIQDLPERRRHIVLAAWGQDQSYEQIAASHGVSVRTTQIEVKNALEHCARALGRK